MPHFVVEYFDRPGSGEARTANRQAHIDYRKALGQGLVLAGPLFDNFDGSPAIGSMVIIEAPDKAGATRIAHEDPYAKAGVFAEIKVFAHRILVLNPPPPAPKA